MMMMMGEKIRNVADESFLTLVRLTVRELVCWYDDARRLG